MSSTSQVVVWTPHPKQAKALKRLEFEILYGGARGGGKTDAGINWLVYDVDNPNLRALIIRRNADDLRDWTDRANQIYYKLGARRAGNPPEFRWPSGAVFRTGHLKDEQAYTKYQGHEYQRMVIEELNQIHTEEQYLRLLASCRSTDKKLKSQVFATSNPGGVGHSWVKDRFVAPPPSRVIGYKGISKPFRDKISGRTRIFIPATIDDNPTLMEADPAYVKTLEALKETNEELYRAWRFGDWDVFAGQVFSEFRRNRHVIQRLTPKKSLTHFLWFDWGFTAPFACYASALIEMKAQDGVKFRRVVTYQEWYGTEKTPDEWAIEIYKTARHRKFKKGLVDPDMLNRQKDGSISLGDLMRRKWRELNKGHWLRLEGGNNRRPSQVPTMKNWLSKAPDGMPYWLITENCTELIRTLPGLTYDENKVEEIDTANEDHAADACSYGLKAIKFISAHIGGTTKERIFKVQRAMPMEGDKYLGLDLRAFEAKPRKARDWRSI